MVEIVNRIKISTNGSPKKLFNLEDPLYQSSDSHSMKSDESDLVDDSADEESFAGSAFGHEEADINCLFCPYKNCILTEFFLHVHNEHRLDLKNLHNKWHLGKDSLPSLNEYQRIALVNYLRLTYKNCLEKGFDIDKAYEQVVEKYSYIEVDCPIFNPPEELLLPIDSEDRLLWILHSDSDFEQDENEKKNIYEHPDPDCNVSKNPLNDVTAVGFPGGGVTDDGVAGRVKFKNEDKTLRKVSKEDLHYFASYESLEIHREMIADRVRTEAFRNFIMENKDWFKGKVVLDVGCGTGILSMFAVEAGARKVVAVDAANSITRVARSIIADNGFNDKIQIICGKLEDIQLLWMNDEDTVIAIPCGEELPKNSRPFQCGAIISEWMGYCLLYESMVYTVIKARDKYLEPMGWVIPRKAVLGFVAADYKDLQARKRDNFDCPVYGLDLSLLHFPDKELFKNLEVEVAPLSRLTSDPYPFTTIDLLKINELELGQLRCYFKLPIPKSPLACTSLVTYFDCIFDSCQVSGNSLTEESDGNKAAVVVLSTKPHDVPTHWKQTIIHLMDSEGKTVCLSSTTGEEYLEGYISINCNPDPECRRSIVVTLETNFQMRLSKHASRSIHTYFLK